MAQVQIYILLDLMVGSRRLLEIHYWEKNYKNKMQGYLS